MNGLRSAPCGTRIRYMGGCRCVDCRKANSLYCVAVQVAAREGRGNPVVSAAPAQAHILKLSKQGVGYRAVATRAGVSRTIVAEIRAGRRLRARRLTVEAILAVTPAMKAPSSHVSAARTWKLIDELLDEGYTKAFLAEQLGLSKLQFSKTRVWVKTARQIEALHRRLTS